MEVLLALVIGVMVTCGVYLMLAPNMLRFLFGLVLVSTATNLTIFVSGRLTEGSAALVRPGFDAPVGDVANALPQALVLTAIVIGFGLFAFTIALVLRAYSTMNTMDPNKMRLAEPVETHDKEDA
ncbi:MAG: NADH-quinone oxidoreductase subunit K [Paracoccus sp. (in: a-proteobacteria)]|nr:NADH-quinone oxidoreductase subunit K [Paracoccus sp. (in: a-proteobacteria)]